MPYWRNRGVLYFFSHSQWVELRNRALAEESDDFRIDSMIAGTQASTKADSLLDSYLERQWSSDPDMFWKLYGEFSLDGDEARRNVSMLFMDFAELNDGVWVSRGLQQDFESVAVEHFHGLDVQFPLGLVIELSCSVRRQAPWWASLAVRRKSRVSNWKILIAIPEVRRIQGTLERFVVQTGSGRIVVGHDVVVLPS